MNEEQPTTTPEASTPARQGIPLPLHRPRVTFVLLGVIGVVFVIQLLTDTLNFPISLIDLGVQINLAVAHGAYWRLLTAMFIHFGILHFLFNAWALFVLGQEVEALYGSSRFALIYFLGGLFGGMASYFLAPADWLTVPSAGASGAIFAVIGADIAFFARNRQALGRLGRQRLGSLAIIVAINLVFGFTPGSSINNYAHLGGLIGGLVLGLGLTPHYTVAWNDGAPRLLNQTSLALQVAVVIAVVVLFLFGMSLGNRRWAPYISLSAQPSVASMAVPHSPADGLGFWPSRV